MQYRQRLLSRFTLLLLLLMLWHGLTLLSATSLLPTPWETFMKVGEIFVREQSTVIVSGGIWDHFQATLYRIFVGFGGAIVVGLVVGIVMGTSRYGERFFTDYVTVGMSLPSLFVAALSAMWFGISYKTAFVATGIITFPFVARNIYEGIKTIDRGLIQMARTYGISNGRIVAEVVLPSIMPFFFAALRYGFAMAWKIATLVELFAAERGVGYMISSAFKRESLAEVVAWTFLFTVFILIVEYAVFQPVERWVFRWRPKVDFTAAA